MKLQKLTKRVLVDSIILTEEEKKKERFVSDTTEWLSKTDWDYFLTLTFKHPVKDEITVTKAIEKFINNLSRKSFGSRSNKRIVCFSAIEKSFDNSLHIHMIIQDPT
ncbi:hypothetical protein [Vreelandella massiliensis]|uniref:hypothetical protein n=1 Tax=Vreelandella massiliensis TaxID=1816686 RepID=UPI00096A4647|nr:hypothetical protein [Halomonas massiliensis]